MLLNIFDNVPCTAGDDTEALEFAEEYNFDHHEQTAREDTDSLCLGNVNEVSVWQASDGSYFFADEV